jgi:serralysin
MTGFTPADEFAVNTVTAGEQDRPAIVVLESGNYVVAWTGPPQSGAGAGQVRAQIYARDGSRIGAEFVINTGATQFSPNVDLVALPGGGFVATWAGSAPADSDQKDVRVQIFNGDGSRVGSEFIANTTTYSTQDDPHIALLANGNFVITWTCATGISGVSLDYQVMGQIFTPAGAKAGSELVINPSVANYQSSSDVTALVGGGFVVTWSDSSNAFGDPGGVAAQVYSDTGTRVGGAFLVNTVKTNAQGGATVAALGDGGFVVAWIDRSGHSAGGGYFVKAQRFDSSGAKVGGEIVADNSASGYVDEARVTALAGGGFILAWGSYALWGAPPGTPPTHETHAQAFDDGGNAVGAAFLLNPADAGNQEHPFLAALADGGFIAAYQDDADPGSLSDVLGITARAFAADRSGGTIYGTGSADSLEGGDLDDFLGGYEGADSLSGGGGADLLSGGAGDDLLDGGAGADRMLGGFGNDIYEVGESGDAVIETLGQGTDEIRTALAAYTLPTGVEALTGTSASGQTLTGNGLNNILTGNAGDDTLTGGAGDDLLDGGAGADTMTGGAGNDAYVVDNDGDVVTEVAGQGTDEIRTAAASYALHTANVENLRGLSDAGQALTGDGLANRIEGAGGDDLLDGGGGLDTLVGGAGDDVLHGGDDADKLDGGAGSDALHGGAGNDSLTFRAEPGSGDVDSADGGEGIDTLLVSFPDTPAPTGIRFAVTENPDGSHDGYYSSGTERVDFTGIERFQVSGTGAADEIGGGSGSDFLIGMAGDDLLTGGGGSDLLAGAEGNDTMVGGAGNDVFVVGDAGDIVVEAENEGLDRVDTDLASYALAANVETLVGTLETGQSLTGNALANNILGFLGNDVLDGGAGADLLDGYTGNDVYIVDNVGDTIVDASGTDEVRTALAGFSLAPFTTVENLTGTSGGGQTLTGNALSNTIRGGGGADMLYGGGNVDFLYGGAGDDLLDGGTSGDRMEGGTGNDIYYVDNAVENVVELAGEGIDEVSTALGVYVLAANVENLTGTSASSQDLSGNALNNLVSGGAGGDTIRVHDGGVDTVNGGGGNDIVYFRNMFTAADRVDGGAGADTVALQGFNYFNFNFAAATLADVETLLLLARADTRFGVTMLVSPHNYGLTTLDANVAAGAMLTIDATTLATDERLTFNGAAESDGRFWIRGGRGTDALTGGAGSDTLDGGAGADTMTGGLGDDVYVVDNAADIVTEAAGEGSDEVRTSLASYGLGANLEDLTGTAATGQDLRGNGLDNEILGGLGGDTIRLQDGGADSAVGGNGDDMIYFGASFGAGDSVGGGGGYDELVLQGNYAALSLSSATVTGIEKLSLLSGGDARFGAAGGESFSYQVTLADSAVTAGSQLSIDARGLADAETLVFDGAAETDGGLIVYGGAGADTIRGGEVRDELFGGRGDDLIEGGAGDDKVGDSDDGSDILRGQGGNDFLNFYRGPTGHWETATIEGGDGNDHADFEVGTAGAAAIDMGAGDDLVELEAVLGTARITLGAGRDTIDIGSVPLLSGPGREVSVTDFEAGAGGDRLLWSAALQAALPGYLPGRNPFASGHARLVQDGADTLLEVSRDADGNFVTLLRFENRQAADFTGDNFEGWSLTFTAPVVDLNGGGETGNDFTVAYTEGGTAAIAGADLVITDADSGELLESATITLADPLAGDTLSVAGALPGTLAASLATVGGHAVLTIAGTGTIAEYQQAIGQVRFSNTGNNPTAFGAAPTRTVTIAVNDGDLLSNVATTIVDVTGVNDGPVFVVAPGFTLVEDGSRVFSTANGNALRVSDADAGSADALSVTISAAHGTLTLSGVAALGFTDGDGAGDAAMTFTGTAAAINAALQGLSYAPFGDYYGADLLSFSVNDLGHDGTGGAKSDSKTINVTISPVADIAANSAALQEDSPTALNLLANDSFENAGRSIVSVGAALHGTAGIHDNGTPDKADDYVVYTPSADYFGTDSFTYTVNSGGATETATVSLAVTAVADGATDTITVGEDSGRTNLDLLANDNFESPGRVVWGVGFASHGTVTYDTNGTSDRSDDFVAYTPDADYEGTDSFVYVVLSGGVTEDVVVNVTVTAAADILADSVTVAEDSGATTLALLANDNFENAGRAITAVGLASHGTVTINNNGTVANKTDDFVTYRPSANYYGADSFTYTVTANGRTETATVTVAVTSVNDAPTGTNATFTIGEDARRILSVSDFGFVDVDGNGLSTVIFAADSKPTGGNLYFDSDGPGGSATPFKIILTEGVSYGVTASDIAAGRLSFLSDPDLNGTAAATITFAVSDDGAYSNGNQNLDPTPDTLTFNVIAAVDAVADTVMLAEDAGATRLDLLANDGFANLLRAISAVGAAAHGTVTINDAGTAGDASDDYVVYTPFADYFGPDSFTYSVTSGGKTETATVSVTVTPVADIVADSFTAYEDSGAHNHFLTGNDHFENGGRAIVSVVQPAHGTVTINNAGTGDPVDDYVVYTPYAGYSGPDSYTYSVASNGAVETGTVTIEVTAIANHAPSGTDAAFIVFEGGRHIFTLGDFGFTDRDGDQLDSVQIRAGSPPAGGSLYADYDGSGPDGPTKVVFPEGLASIAFDSLFIANGWLSFVPDEGPGAPAAATVTFTVTDDGVQGNGNQHIDPTPNRLTFLITPRSEAPELDLDGAAAGTSATLVYDENDEATPIAPNATVTDPDSGNFSGGTLTVEITAHADAGDRLTVIEQGIGVGLISLFADRVFYGNAMIGALSGGEGGAPLLIYLTGDATPGAVEALVRQIGYHSLSDDQGSRTLTFTLDDGAGAISEVSTATVNIAAVNDPPTGGNSTVTMVEDGSRLLTAADFKFADGDGDNFSGVEIRNVQGGSLYYDADGPAGSAYQPVAVTGPAADFSAADLAAGRLSFRPDADAFGTARASFEFRVVDDGGTANGGEDTARAPNAFIFNITAVNDAPVLTTSAGKAAFVEGDNAPGTPVAVDPGITLTDIDGGRTTNATIQFTVGGPGDELRFVNDDPIAYGDIRRLPDTGNAIVLVSDSGASLAQWQNALRSITYVNLEELPLESDRSVSFIVRQEDAAGKGILSNYADRQVTLTAVNDTPVNHLPGAQTIDAGGSVVFSAANGNAITTSDPDAQGSSITIILSAPNGAFALANIAGLWMDGQGTDRLWVRGTEAEVNAALDGVSYTPPAGASGPRTITVTSEDHSTSPSANRTDTVLVNVSAVAGTAGNDFFYFQQAGDDAGVGGDGNDSFYYGAAFTAADRNDGGDGARDVVVLQGDYQLVLDADSLANVEFLSLQSGSRAVFGDRSNARYSYDLTAVDDNVGAGQLLTVNGQSLLAGEDFSFDGSAEIDGKFLVYGGHGVDTLVGGAGNDTFFFEGDRWDAADTVDGGAGRDALILARGNGTHHFEFAEGSLTSIEAISVNNRYATDRTGVPSYEVVLKNGNVTAGGDMIVNGSSLETNQTLSVDASLVRDGTVRLYGGAGADRCVGGAGNDLLYGGLGADYLKGDGGADTYQYRSASESTGVNYDTLDGFDFGVDLLDLPGVHDGPLGSQSGGILRSAAFDADLGMAMGGILTPGAAVLFDPDGGDLAGRTFLIVDQNGMAGYQAGEDFVFDVTASPPPGPIVPDFIV